MYIATVIPIQRGIPLDTLTYYSNDSIPEGAFVRVPLGKTSITGLVIECIPLMQAKMSVKHATFSLKKVKEVLSVTPLSHAIVTGLAEAKKKTLAPIGALAALVTNDVLIETLSADTPLAATPARINPQVLPLVVYGARDERTDQYKRIIRSLFADKQSVVFIAPSIRALEEWYKTLSKGIADHAVVFHSKKTKKDQRVAIARLKQSERPLLICATPQYALTTRGDIGAVIFEEESSGLYDSSDRFGVSLRTVLSEIFRAHGTHVVYGDILPQFETLIAAEATALPRSFLPEKLIVAPVEPYRTVLPTETVELIRYCQKQKKTLFLYTNRKGIAPLSRCSDCGTIVECQTCTLPMVLRYKISDGEKVRLFSCSHCGDTLPPTHTCTLCSGWNITPVSVGTDSIVEAVKHIVPEESVVSVDDDETLDGKAADKLLEDIQKRKWFVMVGTQRLLPYIKQVDYIALPFFDRIISTPSPYTVEKTLRLLYECNERAKESVVVCTRHPEFPLTEQLATKKVQQMIDDDIEARRLIKYPPFGTLLKLTVTVPSSQREAVVAKVDSFFAEYERSAHPPRRASLGSLKLVCVWIVSVPSTYLDDQASELAAFLETLRFPYHIDTHPERL